MQLKSMEMGEAWPDTHDEEVSREFDWMKDLRSRKPKF